MNAFLKCLCTRLVLSQIVLLGIIAVAAAGALPPIAILQQTMEFNEGSYKHRFIRWTVFFLLCSKLLKLPSHLNMQIWLQFRISQWNQSRRKWSGETNHTRGVRNDIARQLLLHRPWWHSDQSWLGCRWKRIPTLRCPPSRCPADAPTRRQIVGWLESSWKTLKFL